MAIVYDPKELLKKIAPEAKIKRLVKGDLTLKKAALSFVDAVDYIDKKSVAEVALNTVRSYQEREAKAQVEAGFDSNAGKELASDIKKDPKLLINRVQNEVVFQISREIKSTYEGEEYEWLPSDADEPDPEHQTLYGTIRVIGVGEMPGERYGCRCGMRILVKQTKLELGS